MDEGHFDLGGYVNQQNCRIWGTENHQSAVKDICYAEKPETIDTLKDNIREAICEIHLHTIDMCLKIGTIAIE